MSKWNGFLFSKQYLLGSKSEGPVYYLQEINYNETGITKKANLWQEDKLLQLFLGKKVTIEGVIKDGKIQYSTVKAYDPISEIVEKKLLEIKISSKKVIKKDCTMVEITFSVRWPYRSIWYGECPNGKQYEFLLVDGEKQIAVWSHGRIFDDNEMEIKIPGGKATIYNEVIVLDSDIELSNHMEVIGIFIASGQYVECKIEM